MSLDDPQWFAVWTNSHCEQLVHDQLTAKGFCAFLPTLARWSRRSDVRRQIRQPMFPGYLFVQDSMAKRSYIEIMKTRGVVRILGDRWDSLAPIPHHEIEAIRTLMRSDAPSMPYPYLREGQRVRIVEGPLADLEGILLRIRPNRGLLVLSVDLLQRSIAVEVDCRVVEPVSVPSPALTAAVSGLSAVVGR